MIRHIVMFRWKDSFTEEIRARWIEGLEKLHGEIPGLLAVQHGPDVVKTDKSWGHVIIADFEDRDALTVYNTHPAHEAIKLFSLPNVRDLAYVDLDLPAGTAAALAFPQLFFPGGDPAIAAIASFATFGVAYIARPLGGLVMGHFGDRLGRKNVPLVTLMIMGLTSLVIGLLPAFETIGIWATVLLVVCRLAQGFSADAESAGASSLTIAHSPEGRRGFFTSFVMMGYAAGMVLSTVVFIPIAALPEEALMSWGWRIPFLLSIFVLGIAFYVRTKLDETPVFEEEMAEAGAVKKLPAGEVLKYQGGDVFRVLLMSAFSVMQTIFTVFGLSYAVDHGGFERTSRGLTTARRRHPTPTGLPRSLTLRTDPPSQAARAAPPLRADRRY